MGMLALIIIFFYLTISNMIFAGLPFVVSRTLENPFDGLSMSLAATWAVLYIVYWHDASKLAVTTRWLLMISCPPICFFVSFFLLKSISLFITLYPVIPETLTGIAILAGYLLIVLAVVIIPNSYMLEKIIAKKHHSDNSSKQLLVWNSKKVFLIISLITDVIFPLFLIYNIVYRNQHLIVLLLSTSITRIAYLYLTSKYNHQISSTTSITIRIISFFVCCASLAVMIFVGAGNIS